MKNLFWTLWLVIGVSFVSWSSTVYAAGEMKEVCKDKKDKAGKVVHSKDGKPVQECKQIKVHKKVEGEKVPEKKK